MSDPFPYEGATALVTGGSSGIGRAIAGALRERGVVKIILVARESDRLDEAARELKGTSYAADLLEHDAAEKLGRRLSNEGITVDLLVNAAGLGSAGPFVAKDRGSAPLDILDVNARALTALTEVFLPAMLRRGRGGILNVASTAGHMPVPFSAVYAATKAYVISLTQALWAENLDSGVRIAGIVPGVTKTNLGGEGQGEVRGSLEKVKTADPADVAETALKALDENDPARVHGTRNALLSAGLELLPEKTAAKILARFKAPSETEHA